MIPTPFIDTDHIVANIDIAPTVLDLAGIPIPDSVDGVSLTNIWSGKTAWREGVLLEGWSGRGNYRGIHTKDYVYAETDGDKSEFYDLKKDPYQMDNLIDDPAYQELLKKINIQKQVPTLTP